ARGTRRRPVRPSPSRLTPGRRGRTGRVNWATGRRRRRWAWIVGRRRRPGSGVTGSTCGGCPRRRRRRCRRWRGGGAGRWGRVGVTLGSVVQAAWGLLLSRYSGQTEVVFGTTVAGRPAALAGVESRVGRFSNTLPVRLRVEPREAVGPWLRQVQERLTELRQYEDASLAGVQRYTGV